MAGTTQETAATATYEARLEVCAHAHAPYYTHRPAAVPEGFSVITEGAASILRQATEAFYNPVQVINRDTSIAVLRQFLKVLQQEQAGKQKRSKQRGVRKAGFKGRCTVFEAMAASGLRSIRYAKEVGGDAAMCG